MKLTNLLIQKKTEIVDRWTKLLYDSYPAQTSTFLKKEKNKFDNPMGFRFAQGLKGIFEALVQEADTEQLMAALDEVIRIRALQDCHPSQALAFLFLLKNIIRDELAEDLAKQNLTDGLLELDYRIDGLALLGFDVYTRRREKLHVMRVNEAKNRISGFMRKTGLSIE